jgi:hypothetical protein
MWNARGLSFLGLYANNDRGDSDMTTRSAAHATEAFRSGRRRRAVRSGLEQGVDGMMAAGGLLIANTALGMGLGLPEGAAGLSLGTGLVCAGLAWITRRRHSVRPQTATEITMRAPAPQLATVTRITRAA